MPRSTFLAFLLVLAASGVALADVITLADGRTLEGKVEMVEKETADGETVQVLVLHTRHGSVRFDPTEVVHIEEKPTFEEELDAALLALEESEDPESAKLPRLIELARQCEEQRWPAMARDIYLHALSVDADYLPAREALGYQLVDGKWMTEDEIKVAEGLVKHKGRWVHPDEVRAGEAAAYWKKMQKQVDRLKKKMGSKVASRRDDAYEEMVALREEIPGIVQAADVLRDYYDRYYQALAARGEVILEVRATVGRLKRPIETFQTTLATGGANNQVSIQIPELSVSSVNTTVAVPALR